jgi:hypothetical protein
MCKSSSLAVGIDSRDPSPDSPRIVQTHGWAAYSAREDTPPVSVGRRAMSWVDFEVDEIKDDSD